MIAALYVATDGCYQGLANVDLWDAARDARLYDGPWPVVAHPPCGTWCQLASVNEARWGKQVGDDEGCFAAALQAVRTWGGVLEHPAHSVAWRVFDLPRPQRGLWRGSLLDPGIVTEISQAAYGHPARKHTWLYAVNVEPFPLDWSDPEAEGLVGAGVNSHWGAGRMRVERAAASATPPAFRDALVRLAETCNLVPA